MSIHELTVPRKTAFGAGALAKLPELTGKTGRKAFVLVYNNDPAVKARVKESLEAKGDDIVFCETADGEPEISYIDSCAERCKNDGCDYVVSIGGGSVIDTAKAVAFLQTNQGSVRDYQMGERHVEKTAIPHIAVPTTSGTGAEATKVSVVTNKEKLVKKSIAHASFVPTAVILDPQLTVSLPSRLTALTGLDALSHALESFLSPNASFFTEACSLKAIELIGTNLRRAVRRGEDIEARANMLYASYLAGQSLNAGVGAAHILAQPLSTVTGLSHSLAIAVLLRQVVAVNLSYGQRKYGRVAALLGAEVAGMSEEKAAACCPEALAQLYRDVGIDDTLCSHRIMESEFENVLEVAGRSTLHITTNPGPVTEALLLKILSGSL